MRTSINVLFVMVFLVLLGSTSCERYKWDKPKWDYQTNANPERPRPIVYDDHIAPMFESNNCTDCHNGSIPPDLRVAGSKSALSGSSYLNNTTTIESIIAVQAVDPEHGESLNTLDYFTLLDWIYEETH